jgi:zinc and cadmium transporter
MIEILLASFSVMLASLVGAISVWKTAGAFIERNMRYLVSFSAGVFVMVAWVLAEEVIEVSSTIGSGLLWIFVGVFIIFLFFSLFPTFHHHHDKESCDEDHHSRLDARRILASDALHNIGDGILLTSAFLVSTTLGILTTLSILVHEIIQEISEFFVLRQAGYSTKKALVTNFVVSGSILIGSLGSFFLIDTFHFLEAPIIGIAAGSFIVVVLFDLIPHSIRSSHGKKSYAYHIAWFILGVLLMTGVNSITAGSHVHCTYDDHGSNVDEVGYYDYRHINKDDLHLE